VVFCENCGASLIGKLPLDTKSLESSSQAEKDQMGISASVLTDVKVQGVTVFHEGDLLRLDIEGSPDPIAFKPKTETIFGRRDPATGAMPDVDLTPFAGYRMGVSRRHAAIRFSEENGLDLWDLGSSNGTFLNGQRLSAHRPYRLRDGDELRLGQMLVHVYFESPAKTDTTPPADVTVEPAKEPTAVAESPASEAKADPAASPAAAQAAAPAKPKLEGAAPPVTVPLEPAEIKSAEVAEPMGTINMQRNKIEGLPPAEPKPEAVAAQPAPVAQAAPPAAADAAPAQPAPAASPANVLSPVDAAPAQPAASVEKTEKPDDQEKRD
jgi:pSer/pThr/pTyr-binding forkhead associated (FHA) protein